jgi:hypothetical protein
MFSVQTFYQPLISHTFPFSNFPLEFFSLLKASHTKKPKAKEPSQSPNQKPKKPSKQNPQPSFSGPSINSGKQDGAEVLGEGRDIVTGETCVPASLNASLGDTAVLLFSDSGQGCSYLGLQVKAIEPHLALLTSSSHRLFIIHSPQISEGFYGQGKFTQKVQLNLALKR